MMSKLILACVALEEAVQLNVAALEGAPIVLRLEPAHDEGHGGYFLNSSRIALLGRRGRSIS